MNLFRASTYMFADRSWPKRFGLIALLSPVPILGQLYAMGYANLCLRRALKGNGDADLPEANLGRDLCMRGLRVMLITLICGIVVGLLGAPFFSDQEISANAMAPAIVQALQGPTALLVTIASSVIAAVALARFALTDSIGGGFNLPALWALLRAEPAIWITCAVIGFVASEGAYGLVWVLPLHGGWDIAGTLIASTVLWTYGQMVNTHLIGQAFAWSQRTAALRSAAVRYRW